MSELSAVRFDHGVPPHAFDRIVSRALAAIEAHAADPYLRLIDVALEVGASEWQISSRLKSQTGRGFWAHLNRIRITRARQLLLTSPAPVAAVARAVGYMRVSDLDRHFRQQTDQTPSEFRRGWNGPLEPGARVNSPLTTTLFPAMS